LKTYVVTLAAAAAAGPEIILTMKGS